MGIKTKSDKTSLRGVFSYNACINSWPGQISLNDHI